MKLKVKINLTPKSNSGTIEELAPFDPIKIRNFLIFLVMLFSLISFSVYSLWNEEPTVLIENVVVNTDNNTVVPKIVIDKTPTPSLSQSLPIEEIITTEKLAQADMPLTIINENKVQEIVTEKVIVESNVIETKQVHLTEVQIAAVAYEKTDVVLVEPKMIEKEHVPLVINDITENEFVKRAQLTLGISGREPIDHVELLSLATQKKVYFFTQINNQNNQTIYHRWVYQNTMMAQISHHIGSNQWRTYSSKNFDRGMLGLWQVQVVDESETVLKVIKFMVTK